MRKAEKENVLQLIDSLAQAHGEILGAIIEGQIPSAQNMLGECQEYAISLGAIIEKSEGEDCFTVTLLEEYCEKLFHIHESLNKPVDISDIKRHLDEVINKIRISVQNDIVARKEVVFFPYKASMWDSLESVYLAAKEDPECDAYCVPIPYYDKNPDGTFGEMHYEGNEYPSNIEITDWEQYDFENRRPDAIYIHNPYDNWNYVTSVHPRFYAENLRKYTSKLVYIPYFVLPEIELDDLVAIDGMKHFCYLPGTAYTNKVILQSEKMRQIYINEFIRASEEYGETVNRKMLEERFLGIGSPKFDHTNSQNKENFQIPKSWKRLLVDCDGKWKKIVFYNVTIASLLQADEKMIKKINYVFEFFKEECNDIVLWWRPHPLIEATIASMRPVLWKQYQKIVNKYKEENWGIYDDSPDIHRAIEISDAYYGDMSSVVQMYQETGKPIMIQNVNIME